MKKILAALAIAAGLAGTASAQTLHKQFTVPTSSTTFTITLTTATCSVVAFNSSGVDATITIGTSSGANILTLTVPAGFPALGDDLVLKGLVDSPWSISATGAGVKVDAKCKASP